MPSNDSGSSSDEDYESDDCTTNSEGPESENEAISTYSDDEHDEDEDVINKAIPRCMTRSSTHAATLFTDTPDLDAIDNELLQLHATIRSRSYLPDPLFEPLPRKPPRRVILQLPEHCKTDFRPIVIFCLFFNTLQYQLLCNNTNVYAKAKGAWEGSRYWYDVTVNEMKVFFTCIIWIGIKRTRNIHYY
jgi:hypothetical protein